MKPMTKNTVRKTAIYSTAILFLATTFAGTLLACQIPVFRYAIERWNADRYQVLVLHDAALNDVEQKWVSEIEQHKEQANFELRVLDIKSSSATGYKELWQQHSAGGQSLLVVLYPEGSQDLPNRIASVEPLSEVSAKHICVSPVREKVLENLLAGDSAVWVFVPSGNPELDEPARQRLESQILEDQATLKLPPQEEIEADALFNAECKIPLKLSFSMVSLDRTDKREQFLLHSLLASELDLDQLEQPMAFPVFGRGRVLYALVGAGIGKDMIHEASKYIIAPCSCQVKERNPGFDLLLSADWEKYVGSVSQDTEVSSEPVLLSIPPGRKR